MNDKTHKTNNFVLIDKTTLGHVSVVGSNWKLVLKMFKNWLSFDFLPYS